MADMWLQSRPGRLFLPDSHFFLPYHVARVTKWSEIRGKKAADTQDRV